MVYSDVIRQRFRNPRYRGSLPAPEAAFEDVNPLCGDRIRIECRIADGRLTDARHRGDSCAICAASADLLVELVLGKSVEEAASVPVSTLLERLEADIRSTRMKCVTLRRIVHGQPLVYLDSAASSQKPRQVLEAMQSYYEQTHANVHRSIHTLGEEATEVYEAARDAVRVFIGARFREEVIFTRGTTDGINIVARALALALEPGDEILVTEMEHHSNLIPWQMICRERGAVIKAVPVMGEGVLDLDAFGRLLSPRTRLVALAHVSNVLGTINPVTDMTRRAHEAGALVLLDGAQAAPHLALDVAAIGCDFYVLSAHKMLGPTGIGVLYGRREVLERLEPGLGGSEMIKEVWIDHAQWNDLPWRFEPGTPPIAEAVGLHAAVVYLDKLGMARVEAHERALCRLAMDALERIP